MSNALAGASQFSRLREVWKRSQARLLHSCAGVDRITGQKFGSNLNAQLSMLSRRMREGYLPSGLLAIAKPKDSGGERIICVPTVADRIVQFSLLDQLRHRLKRAGLDNPVSYGLALGKARSVVGARDFACKARCEKPWVYKTDIQKFFDTLDRGVLLDHVTRCLPQRSLRPIVQSFLRAEITDGLGASWRNSVAAAGIQVGLGVRQGMPLSPFFAGAYLRRFDAWLLKQGHPAARYVDDLVVFFDTEAEAINFHARVKDQLASVGLSIGEIGGVGSKTVVYSPDQPADFLGMEVRRKADAYCLFVSAKTVEKIGCKFAELASIEKLLERGVSLTTLGTLISNMQCGYRNAYDAADNFAEFKNKLEDLGLGLKQCILHHLFGSQLDNLTNAELKFVGVS